MDQKDIEEIKERMDWKLNNSWRYITMSKTFQGYPFPASVRQTVYLEPFVKMPHKHDFPQLWYCRKGSYHHIVDGREYLCQEGSLIAVPPGTGHYYWIGEEETVLICLECSFYFLRQLPDDIYIPVVTQMFCHAFAEGSKVPLKHFSLLEGGEREQVERLLLHMVRAQENRELSRKTVLAGFAELYSLPRFALPDQIRSAAKKIIETRVEPLYTAAMYCNKNYLRSMTGDELAKAANMCRTGFYTSFKKLFGVTYTGYLYALRVYRVKQLLGNTDLSLSYIADKLNFTDITYMGKLFKRYYGVTMSQYRRANRSAGGLRHTGELPCDDAFWENITIE